MPSQKKCVLSRYVSHQEIIATIKTMRLHVHNKVTCRTHVNGRSLRGLSNHAPGHLMAGHFRVTSQFCMGGSLMKNHNILFHKPCSLAEFAFHIKRIVQMRCCVVPGLVQVLEKEKPVRSPRRLLRTT